MTIIRRLPTSVLLTVLVAACQAGSVDYGSSAARSELRRTEVAGAGFAHVVFEAVRGDESNTNTRDPLFVYLEGDGRPWAADGASPTANPDPVHAVAYELAESQPFGAVLLGRPCYHGHARDDGCDPELWTSRRYSEAVVASMTAALERIIAREALRPVVLVGYSGGGVLALLVADRVPDVHAVVTLAANLDLAGWTAYHGYEAIDGSLDPLAARALPRGCEIHVAAADDHVVPPSLVQAAAARRPGSVFWIEPDADHACCWSSRWPTMFARIMRELDPARCLDSR